MNLHPVKELNLDKINNLFSKDGSLGLYFAYTWGSGSEFAALQTSDYLKFSDANSSGHKKVQLFSDGAIVDFDGFHPKSNLSYLVLSKGEGQINYHYSEPELDYEASKQMSVSLMEKGKTALIAELHNKSRTICSKENPIHPFSKERSEGNIFLHHTRTEIFSNLITEEENNSFDLNDLNSWMSAGHSNLITSKRVAIYDCDDIINFGKVTKEAKHEVYTRKEFISSFGSYNEALNYCRECNGKQKLGCEFLICESINHMSWH